MAYNTRLHIDKGSSCSSCHKEEQSCECYNKTQYGGKNLLVTDIVQGDCIDTAIEKIDSLLAQISVRQDTQDSYLEEQLLSLRESITTLGTEIDNSNTSTQDSLTVINQSLDEINNNYDSLTTDVQDNTTSITNITNQLSTLESQVQGLETLVNDQTTQITSLGTDVQNNTSGISTLQSDLNTVESNITGLTNSVDELFDETMGKITIQSISQTSWPGSTITNNSLGYKNFTIVSDTLSNNFNTRTLIIDTNLVAEWIIFESASSSTIPSFINTGSIGDIRIGVGIFSEFSISLLPNNQIEIVLKTILDTHKTDVWIRARKLFN